VRVTFKKSLFIKVLGITMLVLPRPALSQHLDKIWSIDLSQDADFQRRIEASQGRLRPPTLDFLNQDQIILAFDDNVPSVDVPRPMPFRFYVINVEASSGQLKRRLAFDVVANTSQAQAIEGGNFLVLSGEALKKFSPSFEETGSWPTPLELHGQPTEQRTRGYIYFNPRYETWRMDIAPGGKEVVLVHVKGPKTMEVTWLKTGDFATIATVDGQPSGQQGISAGNRGVWLFPYGWARLLLSSGQDSDLCDKCIRAYFLTDDLVFLDKRDKYEVKTLSGKKEAEGKLESGTSNFCRAAQENRFAYDTGSMRGSGFPLRTEFAPYMEVKVFDWRSMKQIGKVSFDKPVIRESVSSGFRQTAIALSPDGQRLAILMDSSLSLYKLR
jgi:hypothetical protein